MLYCHHARSDHRIHACQGPVSSDDLLRRILGEPPDIASLSWIREPKRPGACPGGFCSRAANTILILAGRASLPVAPTCQPHGWMAGDGQEGEPDGEDVSSSQKVIVALLANHA